MYCLVSESSVSVAGHGSFIRIMAQNTAKKSQTSDYSELAFLRSDLNPVEHDVERVETCYLEKTLETAGAIRFIQK